jgi:hypothetical protein
MAPDNQVMLAPVPETGVAGAADATLAPTARERVAAIENHVITL